MLKVGFTEVTAKLLLMKKGKDFISRDLLCFRFFHGRNEGNEACGKMTLNTLGEKKVVKVGLVFLV